jgi:hypothetical protein
MELENAAVAMQGGDTPLRQEVAQNYDEDVANQMRGMEIFDYHKSMGGRMAVEDGVAAGWTPENVQMFNQLLDAEAPERQSLGDSLREGLQEGGFNTTDTVDPNGQKVINVGPRE